MFLKQIKIYGFKSFADKIEFDLCDNINGVVGPNGSGKSNIIDAVRWVLGEQSIKSLRGESSVDIIFSGSKSRKPLNSAYVALLFDNSDRTLPIDYNEVSIKRVIYRTGETEYLLNNEKCRLKDINDLLADSGIGRESFNIISQGKIDEILSTKPVDRRVIFESAAGVIKYKKRKEEAIKKLERTNANLDRVKDIIAELEMNLKPLEEQSIKAKKYTEQKSKLKEVEISLITYDVENLTYKEKENRKLIDGVNDEIIKLSRNTSSYDIELINSKNKLKDIEDKISNSQNNLIEITKKIENIDADIRVLKERQKYNKDSNVSLDNLNKLKENELSLTNNLNNIKNKIDIERKKYSDITNISTEYSNKIKEYHDNRNSINNKINQNNREITNIKYRIEYLENSINNNSSLPNSIKSILNNPRFMGVHNTIGKLIEVEDKYSLCVSTSLGGSSNYLVVDTRNDAKELVGYLKQNNLGRATFFPIDTIKERYLDMDTLSKLSVNDSFINTLDKVVSYNKKYDNIIRNQLGNVILVNDIESANEISKLINHKYKIVTLDGQVVNVGGSVTGGSAVKTNNVIKEKYELDENRKKLDTLINNNKEYNDNVLSISKDIDDKESKLYDSKIGIKEIEININKLQEEYNNIDISLNNVSKEIKDLDLINSNNEEDEISKLLKLFYSEKQNKDNLLTDINSMKIDKEQISNSIRELDDIVRNNSLYISKKESYLKELEISTNSMNEKIDNLLLNLSEDYSMTFEHAKERYKLEIDEGTAREELKKLKSEIKNIGYVNLGAIEEYERVKTRYDFLNSQREDLRKAEDTLLEIINEMDEIMKSKFLTTFEEIRKEFKIVFKEMFRGGEAELLLTDEDNLLETGIEIKAVPSGKTMKSLSLLSGGEKTFTAISLLFAILNVRPVPFCLLDEVEAALDDANVESFGNYLDKYRNKTQFILITHKKKTMEFADTLYGITMQESGVSKLVSVKLEDKLK